MKCIVWAAGLALAGCNGNDSSPSTDTGPDDGPPEISLDVTSLTFEAQEVGTSRSDSITVRNVGRSALDIQGVTVDLPFETTFTNHVTLQGGSATIITVIYAPTEIGRFEETLSIVSTDPNHPSMDVGCIGETIRDADGDGFDAGSGVGEDCDDTNPNINPAAEEIWYNAVDDDCTCTNPHCSDLDQDLDGWDYIGLNEYGKFGGDCNDSNPDIHPEADDDWYDGYDTNCDGLNDNDQDFDGYSSSSHTSSGTDCNDLDPLINVDGSEGYNHEDDDCDGDVDYQILSGNAPWVLIGHAANDALGRGLTSGNIDSGFASELIAGAPGYELTGAVAVFVGGALPSAAGADFTTTADYFLEGASGDEIGSEIAYLEDFGTGGAHLAVGATNYSADKGFVAMLLGSEVVAGSSFTDSTALRIEGTTSGAMVGQGIANDLDLDGDGYDELLGSMKSGTAISLFLFAGDTTLTGTHTTTDADARFDVTGTDTTMLGSFPGGGNDFDGDGYEDFLFCNDGGGSGYGEVWVLWGDGTPYSNSSAEDIETAGTAIATGDAALELGFICGSAGDWDGDGKAEAWIYDYGGTDFYLLAGDASLRDGAVDVAASYLALYPFDSFTNDPAEIRDLGDLDDKAGHEIAISLSSERPTVSTVPGQMFVLGPDLGFGLLPDFVENQAQALFWGDKDNDAENYGDTISGRAADVTGAGGSYRTDIVAADPGFDGGMGAVYVYDNYNE